MKVTITLCVLSAFANILTTNSNASFYLLPFRAFELALGVTAFLCSKKLKLNPKSYLVLVPIILTSNSKHHFFFTLTITLITFLLILDSNSSNLSIHPLQWIGERSYTIYLFHWPLLYLENYLVGDNIIAKILTIVVTLFLSSAQYKFIEKPIINLKLENRIIYFITLIILILVGLFCVNQSRTISQLSSKKYFAKIFNVPPRPQWVGNLCSGVKNIQKITNPLETCLGGPSEKPTIYVLGDSHADQFLSMINLVAAKYGYEIRNINQENDREFPQAELNGKMSDSMSYLINKNMIKKGDILILAFHHGKLNEFRDDQIDLRLKINMNVKSTNLYTIMNREISDLTSQDGKVLLVLDTPILGSIQEVESCAIQIKLFKESGCRISKKQFLHTRFRQSYLFKKLEASHSNTMIWDAGRELFGKDEYLEPLAKDGEYIFYDWNHISTFAASTLTKEFQNVIKNLQK